MSRPQSLLRRTLRGGAALCGRAVASREPGITILAYHRVGGNTRQELDLPADAFDWQMHHVAQNFEVATLDEAVALDPREVSLRRRVVVSFDDGYADVYTHAFPILRRYRVPAVIYLPTRFIDTGEPFPWTPDGARPLTWDHIREMVAFGIVTAASHTHSHPNLGRLTPEEIEVELATSRDRLEAELGAARFHFSYPMSSRVTGDYCPPAADGAARRHFRSAAVEGYAVNRPPVDPYRLTRVPVHRSDTPGLFRAGLAGHLRPYAYLSGMARGLRGVRRRMAGRDGER